MKRQFGKWRTEKIGGRTATHVDGNLLVHGQTEVVDLRDVLDRLHVLQKAIRKQIFSSATRNHKEEETKRETHGSVATGSKDDSNLGRRVNVVTRDQASGGVVDERDELDGHLDPLERLAEHGRAVLALRVGVAEALGPSDEHTVVDLVLRARVRELVRRRVEDSDLIKRATLADKNESTRTVKPRAKSDLSPSFRPSWSLKKLLTHSAQKSKSLAPSCCFCSSVNLYLDCLTSNLPPPRRVTRQTRRFVPPKSTAMKSPVSLPEGYCTNINEAACQ